MKKNSTAYSILVVDDEPELCESVATAFEMKGHRVLKAGNGKTALEIVMKQKFDLVLSDVRMSEGDGITLLSYIKDMNIDRPVVALMTGYADVTRDQIFEMGAEAVFEKPFRVMELIRQLTQSLDNRDKRWSEKPNVAPVLRVVQDGLTEKDFKLGRGGFFLSKGFREPKVGQLIEFDLGVSPFETQHLRGLGVIRWVREDKKLSCGVEFVYLEESIRSKVIKIIDSKEARTFIPKD